MLIFAAVACTSPVYCSGIYYFHLGNIGLNTRIIYCRPFNIPVGGMLRIQLGCNDKLRVRRIKLLAGITDNLDFPQRNLPGVARLHRTLFISHKNRLLQASCGSRSSLA
ncbi:hypothetical protein D3C74_453010 [compost metagenome]